jgi:hypothetical protein
MKKVKFEYFIEEENLAEFLTLLNPYISNINVANTINRYPCGEKIPLSTVKQTKQHENQLKDFLNGKELCTEKIWRYFRSRGYSFSRRTFTRFLTQQCALGNLEVKKQNKDKGGFENMWRLKNEN